MHRPTCSRRLRTWLTGDIPCTVSAVDAAGEHVGGSAETCTSTTPRRIPWCRRSSAATRGGATNSFVVSWTNPSLNCRADRARALEALRERNATARARGHADGQGIDRLPALTVPAPGEYRLHVWLEDAAGNQREESAAVAAALRFDPEPPSLPSSQRILLTRCVSWSTLSTGTQVSRAEKSRCAPLVRRPGMDSRPIAKARSLSRTSMTSASARARTSSGPMPWIRLATRPPQAGGPTDPPQRCASGPHRHAACGRGAAHNRAPKGRAAQWPPQGSCGGGSDGSTAT